MYYRSQFCWISHFSHSFWILKKRTKNVSIVFLVLLLVMVKSSFEVTTCYVKQGFCMAKYSLLYICKSWPNCIWAGLEYITTRLFWPWIRTKFLCTCNCCGLSFTPTLINKSLNAFHHNFLNGDGWLARKWANQNCAHIMYRQWERNCNITDSIDKWIQTTFSG